MKNKYRTIYCGEITTKNIGEEIKVAGWVEQIRNLGSLVFVTVRDETGLIQLISEDISLFENLTRESTITATGIVRHRAEGMTNPNMKTGEVEVLIKNYEILGKCTSILPFEITRSRESTEETRLKYRYLDLRNKENHERMLFRSKVIDYIRNQMKDMGFTEFTTPIITTSSPEGARDFVIPSRNYKGKFYALPQAPQIYKQLLMVSGFNRYFQIAPCFRDEDCRADRTLEFYQLDFEMSFATDEDVYAVGENIFYNTFKTFGDKEVSPKPFRRISYKEAMEKYGSDKPDLRINFEINNITDILKNNTSALFTGKCIKSFVVPSSDKSNSWYKKLDEEYREKNISIGFIKINENNEIVGSFAKLLSDEEKDCLVKKFNMVKDNVLFIIIGENNEKFSKLCGTLRIKIANELNLVDTSKFEFCIVNDFPMFEYNEEENKWDFGHNPFSMPQGGLDALNNQNPGDIKAIQYDFVCNGYEMASGAVRNHDIEIMKKAFEIAGYDEEIIKKKFRSLYTAFQYGAPPHAGMAPGIDRMILLLTGEENLREVQLFPPNVSGQDLLMGGPIELDEKQLRELHIKVRD
ncbi:MAG: aspartate--tRNA ligase [Bacilli bacterium]